MNTQLSLIEHIQNSFLSNVKTHHQLIKKTVSILSGTEPLESGNFSKMFQVDEAILNELIDSIYTILSTYEIPDTIQKYAEDNFYSTLLIGLHVILSEAIRMRVTDKQLQSDLHNFQLPQSILSRLVKFISSNRDELNAKARTTRRVNPSVSSFEWRVDVVLKTTSLNRAFSSHVLMRITTSDGEIITFEVPASQFHQIRYSVAKMLVNMQTIDEHPTLARLVD